MLHIKHNRAQHTHENEQFRRIAISLKVLFEQQKWSGLLIGNPFNENYPRFRPDAVLLYDQGLIIIDLKAYSGSITLPKDLVSFNTKEWYAESETDKSRVLIKAGTSFINPFKQLVYYRNAFEEIVSNELNLRGKIQEKRTCALNIFSGPIQLINDIPKELPFYKIVEEKNLGTMLYDYSSTNHFTPDLSVALSTLFSADDWVEHIPMPDVKNRLERRTSIGSDIERAITEFIGSDNSGVLILESMEYSDRDSWMEYVLAKSTDFQIPQTEAWIHSARVGRKVSNKIGIQLQSLYNTIYGGTARSIERDDTKDDESISAEHNQEIVPIRSDEFLDEAAVVILHEAHLVNRSLHQSELLKFGSGRLLDDLLKFLSLDKTKRKLICIGDPYSLSYGKDSDSALNVGAIAEAFSGSIIHYKKPIDIIATSGTRKLRQDLATGIDEKLFNYLNFDWNTGNLEHIANDKIKEQLASWYGEPLDTEPANMVMLYKNSDALKVNKWIKNDLLKNGQDLAQGDLLIVNNNINIPDEMGFAQPTRLFNGMFLLVDSILDKISKPIKLKQNTKEIVLNFTKVRVACLSLPNKTKADIYLLDNYFYSDNDMSGEEMIAFRVFVNQLLAKKLKEYPFEDSQEYMMMMDDESYLSATDEAAELTNRSEVGERVKTKLSTQERGIRKYEKEYKRSYKKRIFLQLLKYDPLINAVYAHFGWALTVHKCIGSSFTNVILNANQGENRGVSNSDYFRWLYSAVSTASGKLLVANPQVIYPLKEVRFEDNAAVTLSNPKKDKTTLSFPGYQVEEIFQEYIPSLLRDNVKGSVCELSKLLGKHGFLIESVTTSGDYMTKVAYSVPEDSEKHMIIVISNKGAKDDWVISSVRIEKSTKVNTKLVNQEIEQLFSSNNPTAADRSIQLPENFRGQQYHLWKSKLKEFGYELNLVELHTNQDVLYIVNEQNIYAKLRVWYKNDGFFSKIEIIEKNDSELGDSLKKWLFDGIKTNTGG